MKKIFLLITLFVVSKSIFAQQITGSWTGSLDIQGTSLPLVFNIKQNGDQFISTLDSPAQGAKDIPVTQTIFVNNQLILDAKSIGIYFKGIYANNQISGSFTQGKIELPLVLTPATTVLEPKRPQTPKAPFDYAIEEVIIVNPVEKNTLAGTLTKPKDKKEFPIAVMITGSGSQNRDEELFNHKPFWVIADDFAKKGIGVLRLDDRGIGGSTMGIANPTSQNFASDISAAVDYLVALGYKKIGLIGHSEGGLIAPMVALENKNVAFVISLAGPGIAIDQLLLLQAKAIATTSGTAPELIQSNAEINQKIYQKIIHNSGENIESELKVLITEAYKNVPKETLPPENKMEELIASQTKQISSPWFVFFLKWKPELYWSKLKIPVLALNGSLDLQVTAKENLAGIKANLEKAKNKNFETIEFDGMNHLFQEAKTGSITEYSEIKQTISPTVLDKMSAWILKR